MTATTTPAARPAALAGLEVEAASVPGAVSAADLFAWFRDDLRPADAAALGRLVLAGSFVPLSRRNAAMLRRAVRGPGRGRGGWSR